MQMGNAGNFVYVVKADNTVEARPIPNATTQGSLLLLDGGIKPGERVVIDGQEKIHVGSKVVISKGGAGKGDSGDDAKQNASGKGSKPDASSDASKPAAKAKATHAPSGQTPGDAQ